MRWGIGFGTERLGLWAHRFPMVAVPVMLALALLVALTLPRVTFDDDIHRAFLSDSALSEAQRAYDAAQSPPRSTVLVHVTSPAPMTAALMAQLRDLSLDLAFVRGVMDVSSPFVLRWPPDAAHPSGRPLFDTQIAEGFAGDLAAFEALGTGLPTSVNSALTALLLGVSVDTEQTSVAEATALITQEVARALPDGLTARLTGEDVISAQIVAGLKGDLVALNLWGVLLITLAALVFLRDLAMAALAVVPALFGTAAVLALSVWLGYPVTVLSNVIPILLLVLGVANGVHLAGGLKEGDTPQQAVARIGPACALTALTTAAAFASIMLTGNAQLYEFAVLGALGTLLSFAVVIVTFALLARVVPLSARPVPTLATHAALMLTGTGQRHPRIVLGVAAGLLILCTAAFSQTRAWFPLYQNLPDDSPTLATNDAIADDFGGVFQMVVETRGSWADTLRIATALDAVEGPHRVLSEVNFARWLGDPAQAPSAEQRALLPEALAAQLRGADGTARLFVSLAEPMRDAQSLAHFDRLHDTAQAAGATRIIGLPAVMRFEAVRLIDQLSIGLVVAAVGATLLVALAFRALWLVPVLLIPNTLPLMLTGASLHLWAAGELSPTAVLALTLAFGIAIDDTVHFLGRFTAARAQGADARRATEIATRSAGRMMVLTTLLLTAGIAVTFLSGFTPVRLFGGMLMMTLWAALLTDLLLLPALLNRRRHATDIR